MTQADSVHSTPPTNTSAIGKIQSPTNPPSEPHDASLYIRIPVTPEEAFQAIGRLRKEARDEIERLIRFLDDTDQHMELEEAVDDGPCDGDTDAEPSLGSFDRVVNQVTAWKTTTAYGSGHDVDCELDRCDHEDSDPAEGKLQRLSLNREAL